MWSLFLIFEEKWNHNENLSIYFRKENMLSIKHFCRRMFIWVAINSRCCYSNLQCYHSVRKHSGYFICLFLIISSFKTVIHFMTLWFYFMIWFVWKSVPYIMVKICLACIKLHTPSLVICDIIEMIIYTFVHWSTTLIYYICTWIITFVWPR